MQRAWHSIRYLNNDYPSLHGLRVLATFMVILSHVLLSQGSGIFRSVGLSISLDMFFVLSGFLISRILFAQLAKPDHLTWGTALNRFYFRRMIRTTFLYYLFLAISVLFMTSQKTWMPLWAEFAFLSNYIGWIGLPRHSWAWSLCVEEHFYLLAPLLCFVVARLLKKESHRLALIFSVMGLLAAISWPDRLASAARLRICGSDCVQDEWFFLAKVYVPSHSRLTEAMMGVLIAYAHFYRRDWFEKTFVLAKWPRRIAGIAGYAGIVFTVTWTQLRGLDPLAVLFTGDLNGIFVSLALLHALASRGIWARLLSSRVFLPLASLSYLAFLLNMPITEYAASLKAARFPELSQLFPGSAVVALMLVATVTTYLASYLGHLAVEKPCLALRDRFLAN